MKLSDLGETTLLEMLKNKISQNLPQDVVGIGDDCAVIPKHNDEAYLITTDLLVEGTHFLSDKIAAKDLGYKVVAVNVSDIAAMGGRPCYAFLSMALPSDLECAWVLDVLSGINEACELYGILLLGGDTTQSDSQQFFNLTLIGEAETSLIKYRHSAELGDIVCVTGHLGDSFAGLQCIQEQKTLTDAVKKLIAQHCRPRAHIAEGQFLAQSKDVHAMMDISDGLAQDLTRLMDASDCGAEINIEALPVSSQLQLIAPQLKQNIADIAAMGGEDYCLLVTVAAENYPALTMLFQDKFKRALTAIGQVTAPGNGLTFLSQGNPYALPGLGYKHF